MSVNIARYAPSGTPVRRENFGATTAVQQYCTVASQWQPYRESLRTMMWRTGVIAVVAGAVLARFWVGVARWPMATSLVLWPSFGGHWVEIWFLNCLRPRLSNRA